MLSRYRTALRIPYIALIAFFVALGCSRIDDTSIVSLRFVETQLPEPIQTDRLIGYYVEDLE